MIPLLWPRRHRRIGAEALVTIGLRSDSGAYQLSEGESHQHRRNCNEREPGPPGFGAYGSAGGQAVLFLYWRLFVYPRGGRGWAGMLVPNQAGSWSEGRGASSAIAG